MSKISPQKTAPLSFKKVCITDRLMVIDPLSYTIVQVNHHFLSATVFSNAAELSGRTCYEILFGRSVPCHKEGIFLPDAQDL